jgi:hypothetical protein
MKASLNILAACVALILLALVLSMPAYFKAAKVAQTNRGCTKALAMGFPVTFDRHGQQVCGRR